MKEIKDFGEKIGGARKDVWAARGLIVEDLESMTSSEKAKFVKRDNIWKKIDQKKLLQTNTRLYVYWLKEVRSCIYPDLKYIGINDSAIEQYVKGIRSFQELILSAKEVLDVEKLNQKMLDGEVFILQYGSSYRLNPKYHGIINGRKLMKLINKCDSSFYALKKEIDKKDFGLTKEEALRKDYLVQKVDGIECGIEIDYAKRVYLFRETGEHSREYYYLQNMEPDIIQKGDFVLLAKKSRSFIFHGTCEAAKQMLEQQIKDKLAASKVKTSKRKRKGKWIPPQLTHLNREGSDHRHGHNVTGDDFMKCFGIRGGEFGNWTNDHDRQTNLNMAFDAFCDMAEALNISRRDIGLIGLETGALAIAFGARGHSGALAHYEPEREVINLTKMKGAGSLAHEWGHALDDFIGKMSEIHKFGKLASMDLMNSKIPACFHDLILCLNKNDEGYTSDYYRDSRVFDGLYGSGYWTSNEEMFARAFACYVKDRLRGQNDYLVGHADTSKCTFEDKMVYAYPVGEDRQRINGKMDQMIAGLKEIGYLHDPIEPYQFYESTKKCITKDIGIKITNVHQMSFADFGI